MPLPVEGFEISEIRPLRMGHRRELFLDRTIIGGLTGTARLRLHRPTPREIVLVHDAPWEGNTCGYATIFRDRQCGNIYRMVYRGSGTDASGEHAAHRPVTCYAESLDGIQWTKPNLGLHSFQGSTQNNILWDGPGSHNFTPFQDTNPDCPPTAKYKAVGGIPADGGLFAFASPDGIHWSRLQERPIMTEGTFDSQNLAFWDQLQGEYRAYIRDFRKADGTGGDYTGVRDIKTCTSADFVHWSPPEWLHYNVAGKLYGPATPSPDAHLYTNQILPYARAPHIFLGFPTRFQPHRESLTEGLLMSSRDGQRFDRWDEALIPPGSNPERWHNRSNYIWWGLVETASATPGAPAELSLYANEHYYKAGAVRIRRFTTRLDGFVSVRADHASGELLTKPLIFEGRHLELNVATSAAGDVRVEIQRPNGRPFDGFSLEASECFYGDAPDHVVRWENGADVSALAGQTVRVRIVLRDADVYAMHFV